MTEAKRHLRAVPDPVEPVRETRTNTPMCKECEGERTWDSGLYYKGTFKSRFKGYCFNCAFWFEIMERYHEARRGKPFIVVNNGNVHQEPGASDLAMYELGTPYQSFEKKSLLGLGGRAFQCVWKDGLTLISNNVWYRGVIPTRFKHPARFGVESNMELFRACGK